MASTGSSTLQLLQNFSITRLYSQAHRTSSSPPACIPPQRTSSSVNISTLPNRRQSLFMLTASTAVGISSSAAAAAAWAKDIPFFGIRKKLEEEAVEILKEGSEVAEKGIEAAEREIVNVEQEIESSAGNVNFGIGGSVMQAGIVLGAEALGVLVATSVVSGILGPEGKVKNPEFLDHISTVCSKDDQLVVGCNSGGKSVRACADLLKDGYKNVKNMGGVYSAWVNNGLAGDSTIPAEEMKTACKFRH